MIFVCILSDHLLLFSSLDVFISDCCAVGFDLLGCLVFYYLFVDYYDACSVCLFVGTLGT